jgi:chromosome segregation ATPase
MNERKWGSQNSITDGRLNDTMNKDEIEAMCDDCDADDYMEDLVELLSQSRNEKDTLERHLRNYQGDNKWLQQQIQKLKNDNQDLNNKVQKLEEE